MIGAGHPVNGGEEASPWLTIEQARRRAKVGAKLLYREVHAGRLRAARLCGGRGPLRIHVEWVDSWLEQAARPVEVRR